MSESRLSLPAAPPEAPGLPSNFIPVAFEKFDTLNTKADRPAIADGEMAWCDGLYPVAPNTLRVLPGTGTPLVAADTGTTIVWFGFGNIYAKQYCFYLQNNGSLRVYDIAAQTKGTVIAAGVVNNPRSIFGFSQWGSQYNIFASDQTNGYWLWNGSTFTAGTLSPFVTLTNSGENYSSAPTWTLQTTGAGSGATFSSQLDGDTISLVNVTNPGSGFGVDDFAIITASGGGSDTQARATVSLSAGGGVTGLTITNPGSGYTFKATVSFSGGGGSGATAVLNIQNGQIIGATIVTPGTGYTSAPSPTFSDPGYGSGANAIAGGSGAAGFVTVGSNGISSISVANGGTNYTSVPQVQIIGDGTGAQAVAVLSSGAVSAINVTNPGQGYTAALALITGGNNAANATVQLMPFSISGTTVEVYTQHVWVANGGAVATFPPQNRVLFSATGSPSDFGDSGGAFLATDSFVRVGYRALKQSNGFLYLIGDSSINNISGVQTTSTLATQTTPAGPPITTFGNVNVDPQLGSPWPSSVQVFSRNIVFANSIGIFVCYGGAVTKASTPLDGFYAVTGNPADYSSAIGNIFGTPVYMLLLPVVDKITKQTVNKLLMWDGKRWFTSQQDRNLTYVATQELNSVLQAWGTDGNLIFPLFQTPTTGFTKTFQSKLDVAPGYWTTKTAVRAHAVVKANAVDSPLNVTLDTEAGAGTGNATVTMQPIGNPEADVLGPYPVGQAGRMIGVTVSTTASNLDIMSISLSEQVFETNV